MPAETRPTNPHAARNRLRKATAILAVLNTAAPDRQIRSSALAAMSEADWRRAAVVAGCRPPSAETREVVAEIVRETERQAAEMCAVFGHAQVGPVCLCGAEVAS